MKPFTKGALISALWWVPAGMALAILLQVGAAMVLGLWLRSSSGSEWASRRFLRPAPFVAAEPGSAYGTADYHLALNTLDGEEVALERFRGKVVFLNFWATWCQPCLWEMPSIARLQASLGDGDVAFVIVSEESPAVVRPFVEQQGWKLPVYLALDEVPEVFAGDGIPRTFVVDRDGAIRFRHPSAADYDTDEARQFLRDLVR